MCSTIWRRFSVSLCCLAIAECLLNVKDVESAERLPRTTKRYVVCAGTLLQQCMSPSPDSPGTDRNSHAMLLSVQIICAISELDAIWIVSMNGPFRL